MSITRINRATERSPQSNVGVVARLRRWREVLGKPMGPGRANPDNDLYFLLLDAEETIGELERYAHHLEERRAPVRELP